MAYAEFTAFLTAIKRTTSRAFGIDDEGRRAVLAPMLEKPHEDRPLYWFELALSMGIATFGLVLNSAGVVIGAMLIAPLMTPILELAMALVIMSSYLLIRALARVLASVVMVVLGAAFITSVLPFHEPTSELLARTAPTVLDLFVAIFCALAAAVTTTRPHAGATSTAAGTAIGIALVPPLCASGFGVGSGDIRIAEGAMLLFTANFCAILVFASLFFWLVGFTPVPQGSAAGRLPDGWLDGRKLRLARLLEERLGGRHGAYIRVLVPAILLASVFLPLQRALAEVSWEVTTRTAVSRLIAAEPLLADALQITSEIERGSVRVGAVVVGTDEQAATLEQRLMVELASASGTRPLVRVRAVPQASLFARPVQAPTRAADPLELISPGQAAGKVVTDVLGSLRRHWPVSVGPLLDARVELGESTPVAVAFTHLGDAIGAAATAVLATAISTDTGGPVTVRAASLSASTLQAPVRDAATWVARVEAPVRLALATPSVVVCMGLPTDAQLRRLPEARRAKAEVLRWFADSEGARLVMIDSDVWRVRFTTGACDEGGD